MHLERYLNFGLTIDELRSGKPIIGIAQSGSDISPCNRHHLELAVRVRDGIIAAGGVPLTFPTHPIQETGKRPGAALDRNLAYLSLVEVLYGYPIDAVVLTIGCDKTTPSQLMAAATLNIPAIALSVGPMLNGWHHGRRTGSGTIAWEAREKLATGEITTNEFLELIASPTTSVGYCNTMGTATTMNSLTEALGMELPGGAAIPAAYRQRGQMSYETGVRIVELANEDLKPSDILTRESFLNAIMVNTALGGSTNAPIHLQAIARHIGVDLALDDWQTHGYDVPLLVNMQPGGEYLGEDFHHAGGVPAVAGELLNAGMLYRDALTVSGKTIGENCIDSTIEDTDVIRPMSNPLKRQAGFIVLTGNIFDSAIMKTSVIDDDFERRYLSDPDDPEAFTGRAVVFDGPEDYNARIEKDLVVDQESILFMRGAGPVGFPGAAEVVNMQPPAALIRAGTTSLACVGDGRQSGTSASPSILNGSPEAAIGGNLAILQTGDPVRIDLRKRRVDMLVDATELAARRNSFEAAGGYPMPESQTPWQEIHRETVGQMDSGMTIDNATAYQRVAQTKGMPRVSH